MTNKLNLNDYTFEEDNAQVVRLGGTDKETGQANPTHLEGYYVGVEVRVSKKYNKPQNFYKFKTSTGLKGIYASAGIDQVMKNKTLGLKTVLINTGEELDVGKGNPMQVYKAGQNKNDSIDVDGPTPPASWSENDSSDEGLFEEESVSLDEVVAAKPVAPSRPAQVTSKSAAAVQALLKNRQSKSA